MSLATRLENFRADNPYDVATQAKRLLAKDDKELLFYVVELGLKYAKQRQQHEARQYIKETGFTRATERMIVSPGRVTGSVVIKTSKRTRNAIRQLILDVWRINGDQRLGDANAAQLGEAINREETSIVGHGKNVTFYKAVMAALEPNETVRQRWTDDTLRPQIEAVYGEFRTSEIAA